MTTDEAVSTGPAALDIPQYHASSIHVSSGGNDVMMIFSRMLPTLDETVIMQPVAAVTLPRGAAADLYQVMGGVLNALTKDFGPIDTPFAKERREGKK